MKKDPVDMLFENKTKFAEIIIMFIALGIIINLTSTLLQEILKNNSVHINIIVFIFFASIIFYFIFKLISKRNFNLNFKGLLILDKEHNKIISVENYRFLEDASSYLEGAFSENPALKEIWKNEMNKLNSLYNITKEDHINLSKDYNLIFNKSTYKLVNELIECVIIKWISIHLTDYFNKKFFRKKHIKTFTRREIHDVLLDNRFLELFSKPMNERIAFKENNSNQIDNIIYSTGENGAIYSQFNLTLPICSKIKRSSNGNLIITGSIVKIEIKPNFNGISSYVPYDFCQYYLGLKNTFEEARFYQFETSISIKFTIKSYLFPIQIKYYKWIKSLNSTLKENISFQNFLQKINWITISIIIKCINNNKNNQL